MDGINFRLQFHIVSKEDINYQAVLGTNLLQFVDIIVSEEGVKFVPRGSCNFGDSSPDPHKYACTLSGDLDICLQVTPYDGVSQNLQDNVDSFVLESDVENCYNKVEDSVELGVLVVGAAGGTETGGRGQRKVPSSTPKCLTPDQLDNFRRNSQGCRSIDNTETFQKGPKMGRSIGKETQATFLKQQVSRRNNKFDSSRNEDSGPNKVTTCLGRDHGEFVDIGVGQGGMDPCGPLCDSASIRVEYPSGGPNVGSGIKRTRKG